MVAEVVETESAQKKREEEEEIALYEGMLEDLEEEAQQQPDPGQEPVQQPGPGKEPPEQEAPPATPPKTPIKAPPRKGPRIKNTNYIKNPEIRKAIKRILINPSKFELSMIKGFTPKQQMDIITTCAAAALAIYSMKREDELQISNDEVEIGTTTKEDLVKWIRREDLVKRKVTDYANKVARQLEQAKMAPLMNREILTPTKRGKISTAAPDVMHSM